MALGQTQWAAFPRGKVLPSQDRQTGQKNKCPLTSGPFFFFNPHPRLCLLMGERERNKEREENIDVREKHASCMHPD